MFGRTLKASVAKDNGKSGDYQSRKTYSTNSFCFECQEEGHFSYQCPKNVLGIREPPAKVDNNKKRKPVNTRQEVAGDEDGPGSCSSSATIRDDNVLSISSKRIKFTKNSYFSDEEEEICE